MTEDELNLWRRWRRGDKAAREALVVKHMREVRHWVREAHRQVPGADHQDLTSAGIVGLLKAINKFDYNRGLEFSTLGRLYIKGEIYASSELTRDIPRTAYENLREIEKVQRQMAEEFNHKATIDELAETTGLTVEQVTNAINARYIARPDGFLDDESGSRPANESADGQQAHPALPHSHESPYKPWETVNDRIRIEQAISQLSELEGSVLTLYFWEDKTDSEIARRLGLTLSGARDTRIRALAKLHSKL